MQSFFIQISFFTAYDGFANVFCVMFHESNFGKMKITDGIKVLKFNIEKAV